MATMAGGARGPIKDKIVVITGAGRGIGLEVIGLPIVILLSARMCYCIWVFQGLILPGPSLRLN